MYAPGVVLGDRYRLEERIGGGGMGEVWRGTDEVLGRTIAVKVMLPSLVRAPGFAQRFLTEARAMASIRHPGVVAIHDYRGDEAGAFLVMEYVPGESLAQLLRRDGPLSPARAMAVLAQAADALAAVHAEGIVHRDLKPGNILVRTDGSVMLTDFGIARSPEAAQLTAAGAVIGTASYLSPEQALGHPAGPASDIYALGIVAYQCLHGRPPFDGDSPLQVAMKHLREEPPPLPAGIPQLVRAVVAKALAKEPPQRWRSAVDLAAAARQAMAANTGAPPAGPTGTRPMTTPDFGAGTSPAPPAPPRPAAAHRPPPPGRRGIAPPPAWSGHARPPAMVTIASLLLLTAAAAFAVYFLAVMAVYETIDQVYREVYTDSQASDLAPVMAGAYAVPALLLLCFGLILVLLAWRTYRGGRTARGWTITLTLFTLCCCGASAAFSSVSYDGLDATEWDQVRAAASQRLAETLPAWFEVISSATVGIGLGALLVATVLLVTGPSNRFFRRRGPMVLSPYPEHPYRPR